MTTMRALEARHVEAILTSDEGHYGTDVREHHHRMLCALREVATELAGRVSAAAQIEARLSLEGDDEEDDIV